MVVSTYDLIRWVIIFLLMLFHCTVTFLIYHMRKQGNNKYTSHFYLLYIITSLVDIGTIINNFFSTKIFFIDPFKPWFIENPLYFTIVWLLSGYLVYFQSIMHAAIAINRTWISFSLMKGISFWDKLGQKLSWLLPVIPLAILSPRFAGTVKVYYTANKDISGIYNEPFVKAYHSTAGPIVVISTSIINFALTVLIIFRYRYLFKKFQYITPSMKQDILLFCHAIVTLLFQLSVVAFYIMIFISSANNLLELQFFALQIYFPFATDASSLCNPIALLIICKFIRQDFVQFFLRSKQRVTTIVSIATNNSLT